jgi:hypothetical protein
METLVHGSKSKCQYVDISYTVDIDERSGLLQPVPLREYSVFFAKSKILRS